MKCPYEEHKLQTVDGNAVWGLLRTPVALRRAGMEGQVVGLAWQELLVLAEAHGVETHIAALLLQPAEVKVVIAINGDSELDQ